MFFFTAELLVSHHRVESSHLHWWYYSDVCVKRKPSWIYPKKPFDIRPPRQLPHQLPFCTSATTSFWIEGFFSHEFLGARNSVVLWMESRHACAKLSSSGGFRHVFFKHHHHHHYHHLETQFTSPQKQKFYCRKFSTSWRCCFFQRMCFSFDKIHPWKRI